MTTHCLLQTHPNPSARVHLFCFPHAGSGAAPYYAWSRDLPATVQVCPVHLPGRENRFREPPFTQMPVLVDELLRELAHWPPNRFAFFGHSLGGLLAFELARALSRPGSNLVHLFISAARSPDLPRRSTPISHLVDADFLAAVQSRYQPLPVVILQDPELLKLFLPALRADFTLFDAYTGSPGEPLDCPLSAFGGDQDPQTPPSDLAGWQRQTRGPFRLRLFAGDHFFLKPQQGPLLRAIAEDLAPWLHER